MSENFDLLGDPIPENRGKRGRPAHIPTRKNRNKVMMLLAMGWTDQGVANALGVSIPTLNKHYFRELKLRDIARDRLKATHMEMLWEQAKKGSVPAIKEFRKLMDKVEAEDAEQHFLTRAAGTPMPRQAKLGKKEEADLAANSAGYGTDWGDDLLGPGRTVN